MKQSHTAGWASDAPTPAQFKEFFAQVASHRITKRKLQGFLRSGQTFKNEDTARLILGDDIIFPDEIAEARGLSYADDQLQCLAETFPAEDVLRFLKANNFALVAGPPQPMSLLDVRSLEPGLFYSQSGDWYTGQDFAKNDKATATWHAIRKDPVPSSTNKSWDEQLDLLSSQEQAPNAGEMGWFITTFYKVCDVRLFEAIYVRTSSVDSLGDRVRVGDFDSIGLYVFDYWDDYRDSSIGLASARKFD